MRLFAVFALLAALVPGPVPTTPSAALRTIEVAELHRSLTSALVADLDATPAIAARAALAIGRTKNREGVPPLRAHLSASVPGVRAMCAYGLGLLADGPSLGALMAYARNDDNSAVRYAAIDAVGRILMADPRSATLILANDGLIVARGDPDPTVRAHAAAQLEAFRGTPYAKAIAASLERAQAQERDETVRWHTAWVIFRGFATVVDAPFLTTALHDRSELVRVEAARAWGRRSDPDAAAIVRPALDDPSWRVQLEAGEALRRLAHQAPTDHLMATPPGLHLPPIPRVRPTATSLAATPVPTPLASPPGTLAAPDPATLPLAEPVLPKTARDLAALRPYAHPRVRIRTTKGDVVVRLVPEWAPATVANFLSLAGHGYFNGNRWFRIVPDFVVQTGDPTDNGEGDAGYSIPAEENPLEERSGVIAMGLNYSKGNALRDSAGTQFYLTLSPQLHLDRDFSVFGEVQSGFDVLAHLIESDRMIAVRRISDG